MLIIYDSFSSQTWAILYLNETLIKSQYRTQPNDSPVRCQNCGYQQYLIKIHTQKFFFHKSWMNSLFYENNIVFNGFLRFWGFQKCAWCGFYHIWNWFNQNFENCVMVNSREFGNILDFDIWLESHLVGFCFDFWSKFHLGTKSPMSGKKMSHWSSVIVEYKSL